MRLFKFSKSSKNSGLSISDDESQNPKYSHLLNWLFSEEIPKSTNLIRLKVIPNKEKAQDDSNIEVLKPLAITSPQNLRTKTNKFIRNLIIQIPEESVVRNSLVFKEEGLLPFKNQVNIEELLDIIEGKNNTKEMNEGSINLHRRSLSERKFNHDQMFNISRFKRLIKEMKNASAIDLVQVLRFIQSEMSNIRNKACYEVRFIYKFLF